MSLSRPEQHVVQHFTHIHPLTKNDEFGEFTCDGCKSYGFGNTYRCTSCDYDLHNYCATCPPTLFSFMHPQHEIRLVLKGPDQMHQNIRICDICDELVDGIYYHCEACGFDVHPLCTQLPQHVSHVSHPAHPLELSLLGTNSTCMVCHGAIGPCRYKCGPCGLDVHMGCVNSSASEARGFQKRSTGKPDYHPPQYHQPYYVQQGSSAAAQPYFHHSQYHQPFHTQQGTYPQPYFHPSQYPQPYHNHGYGYNYGYTNQGQPQTQQTGRSTGKTMFAILMALTVGDFNGVIADPIYDAVHSLF